MEILDHKDDGDLQALEAAWNRLFGHELRFVPHLF
jgi:hypothetical protein